MKTLRKRILWILLTLCLLSGLAFSFWYTGQVRQQRLDDALILAIKTDDTRTAMALLDRGANANAVDRPRKSLLLASLLADFRNRLQGNSPSQEIYPSALFLVVTGYRHHYRNTFLPDGYRILPLPDNAELVAALLEHGANPYRLDKTECSALHWACRSDCPKTLQVLLEHHVNPNCKDGEGKTPLMYLVKWRSPMIRDCAELLIANGADVNAADAKGATALMKFAALGDVQATDFLLAHQAQVSRQDAYGNTAMIYAKSEGQKQLLPLLDEATKKAQAEQKPASNTIVK